LIFTVDNDNLRTACKDQLNLVLSFFPRVESKSSVVLAIDTGMAAFLASNAPPLAIFSLWMWMTSGLTLVLLGTSVVVLYRGSFPNLAGGESSLIYFREIAKRTEHRFVEEFSAQSEKHYASDLLGQVWRNSQILSIKFDCLKRAFIFMALAIVPWIASLALFAAYNGAAHPTLFKP
jgi:hypothetical protein